MTKGCAILPFQTTIGNPAYVTVNGQAIVAPDRPFLANDDPGSYSVRAFNNGGTGDLGTKDGDGIITLRALGNVNGRIKVIQFNVLASTALGIFSCQGNPGDPCPEVVNGHPVIDYMGGRDPMSMPTLPTPMPLSDPSNYFLHRSNFPGITQTVEIPAGDTLSESAGPNKIKVENNTLYFVNTGNSSSKIEVDVNSATNIVVVNQTGSIDVKSGHLTNAVVAATGEVMLGGGSKTSIRAPANNPAIVAGSVSQGASSVEIWGGIYATGKINLNPITVHGVLVGNPIEIQGSAGTTFTDEGMPPHYATMPGITYPDEIKNTLVILQSWKEVQ